MLTMARKCTRWDALVAGAALATTVTGVGAACWAAKTVDCCQLLQNPPHYSCPAGTNCNTTEEGTCCLDQIIPNPQNHHELAGPEVQGEDDRATPTECACEYTIYQCTGHPYYNCSAAGNREDSAYSTAIDGEPCSGDPTRD